MSKETKEGKFKVIEETIAKLEKNYGKGSVMRLEDHPIQDIPVISTGCLSLDYALGVGGVPKGRIIEIYGPEAGGKSTLALHIVAECQKAGGEAVYIDSEHAMDLKYAKKLGVDTKKLIFSQPDFGEQALEMVETWVRSSAIDIIVVDSVAALTPKSEIEGDMGDPQMALQARLMSQAMRKLVAAVSNSKTCLVFINQLRQKVGISWGNPENTTGGNALKFYASVRIDVRRIAAIKSGNDVTGNHVKIKVVKNKVAPPFREVEVDIIFGEGIDSLGDLIELAINFGLILKSGAWFTYGEDRYQGKEQLKQSLKSNSLFIENLKAQVKQHMNTGEIVSNTEKVSE